MEPLGFLSLGKNGCTGLAQRRLTGCRNIRIIEISGHAAFRCCMVLHETSRNTEAIWIVERIGSMKKKVQAWLAAAMTATMLMSHAALPAVHAEEINRNDLSVLILGDDVSAGVGLQEGEQAYGELVASYLGTENVQNYAQEGATTDSLLNLIQTDDIVQASIAEADIILISVGANDIYQTVLQNEYINISDYNSMQAVLNSLDSNTRLNLSKYLRNAMPPVVEQAVSNIQEITKAVYAVNSGADIVFQDVYNPLSVSKMCRSAYALFKPWLVLHQCWNIGLAAEWNWAACHCAGNHSDAEFAGREWNGIIRCLPEQRCSRILIRCGCHR